MTREEAIHFAECLKHNYTIYFNDMEEFCDMAIKALEQEPRKGHWIMTSDYLTTAYGSVDYVKCSCCGEDSLEEGNYCPNCGTRMVEPQESEE